MILLLEVNKKYSTYRKCFSIEINYNDVYCKTIDTLTKGVPKKKTLNNFFIQSK